MLRDRTIRRFLLANFASYTNIWMFRIAQDWLIVTNWDDPSLLLGLATAAQFSPMLALGLWGGSLADRLSKITLMVYADRVAALIALTLGVLTLVDILSAAAIVTAALVTGVAAALSAAARQTAAVELVEPRRRGSVIALVSMTFNLGRICGPALAGVAIGLAGTGVTFLVVGLTSVVAAQVFSSCAGRAPAISPRSSSGTVRAGLRFVAQRRDFVALVCALWFFCMIGWNSQLMITLMSRLVYDVDAQRYAFLGVMFAAGSMLGSLYVAWRGGLSGRGLVLAAITFNVLLALVTLAPSYALFAALLVPLGATSLIVANSTSIYFQTETPDWLRGRVIAVYVTITSGSVPVGALLAGWASDRWGPRAAFVAGGLLGLAAVCGALAHLGWSRRRDTASGTRAPRPRSRVA